MYFEKIGTSLPGKLAAVSKSGNTDAAAMRRALTPLRATPVVVSKSRYSNSAKVMWVGVVIVEYQGWE
jgi:hypothetical protein